MTKFTSGLLAVAFLSLPVFAFAQTNVNLEVQQKIAEILAQISVLQAEITNQGGQVVSNSPTCVNLLKNLNLGSVDSSTSKEVEQLQDFLKQAGFYTYPHSTGYFGNVTKQALINFQTKYGVVEPIGVGSLGINTQAKLRELSCGNVFNPTINPQNLPSGQINRNYTITLAVDAGAGKTWTMFLSQGTLPRGINFGYSAVGTTLSGVPTSAGVYKFTVTAVATDGQKVSRDYLLIVNDADGMLFGA